ncbi:hypothetical protein C0V76_02665 [Uliginosibacterium sp. TH139]|nr:hypothetical protein C0V76_02665 [Uliginosibacterium sp. TH139]
MRKRSPRLLREVLSESLVIELSEYFKVDATKVAGVAASGALVERVYAKSVIDLGLTKPQTSVSPNDIGLGRQIDKKAQELGVKTAQLEELFRYLDALEGVPQQDYSRAIENFDVLP